jgi:hypothetical protein
MFIGLVAGVDAETNRLMPPLKNDLAYFTQISTLHYSASHFVTVTCDFEQRGRAAEKEANDSNVTSK